MAVAWAAGAMATAVLAFCRMAGQPFGTDGRGARGILGFVGGVLCVGPANSCVGSELRIVTAAGVPVLGDNWREYCRLGALRTTETTGSMPCRQRQNGAGFCLELSVMLSHGNGNASHAVRKALGVSWKALVASIRLITSAQRLTTTNSFLSQSVAEIQRLFSAGVGGRELRRKRGRRIY